MKMEYLLAGMGFMLWGAFCYWLGGRRPRRRYLQAAFSEPPPGRAVPIVLGDHAFEAWLGPERLAYIEAVSGKSYLQFFLEMADPEMMSIENISLLVTALCGHDPRLSSPEDARRFFSLSNGHAIARVTARLIDQELSPPALTVDDILGGG